MKNRLPLLGALALALFIILTIATAAGHTGSFDDLRFNFYGIRQDGLTIIMKIVTHSADWLFIVCCCLALMLIPSVRRTAGIQISLGTLLSWLLQHSLKLVFQRPRPADILPLVTENSFSYPSGHATVGMTFYALLAFCLIGEIKNKTVRKYLTGLALIWIFMIGISRIYLGVHYPSDVLSGWLLGGGFVLVFKYAADRLSAKDVRNQG